MNQSDLKDKDKLLIYSDCYIYGGSECLLSSIIFSSVIKESYQIHFAYRKHKQYEGGLSTQYGKNRHNFHPLFILSNDTIFYKINKLKYNSIIKKSLMFPLWCLRKTGFYFFYNFFVALLLIKKIKPQVIHINNGGYPGARSCAAVVLAARVRKVRNIIYQVNNIAYKSKTKIAVWFDKNIIDNNVKCFITASQKAKECLAQNRGFSLDKIIIVPNTTFDKSIIKSRYEILKEFSWPSDSFLLCEVAFLSKRKGQIILLEAMKKIRSVDLDFFGKLRLILVGDGEEEILLKKFVDDNNLNLNISFTGYRSDSIDFINACDIFILPSIANEDMPLVILEAMKLGKTIIASKFGGIEEEIENNISGILLEPNPETLPLDIVETIINYYNNRTDAYGLNAKKRYYTHFSSERREEHLIEIYKLVFNKVNSNI